MLKVEIKEGASVERALKILKRKFEKVGVIKELRRRQAFVKPSVERRMEIQKAIYVQKLRQEEEDN
jgi:small subunit ribosomal protein S21